MTKSITKFLSITVMLMLIFLLVACGEDQEISPGHYKGPRGGTYTISPSGNKEYYGNNGYGSESNFYGTFIIIIVIVAILIFVIFLSVFLISKNKKDIYVDPMIGYLFCRDSSCQNIFIFRNNRKYCENHSSSKAKVNISKKTLITRERKITKELFSNKKYIYNLITNKNPSSSRSFVWYLYSKKEIDLRKENSEVKDREKFYKKYENLYFKEFASWKYRK